MDEKNGSADSPSDESNPLSEKTGRDLIRAQMERYAPETGYKLVEWDLMKAPEDRLVPWSSSHELKLSEMSPRQKSEWQDWSIIDRDTNNYHGRLQDLPADPDPETLDTALDAVLADEESTRIALVRITRIASNAPEVCREAIPVLTEQLADADPAVQAEIVGICARVVEAHPDEGVAVADELFQLITPEAHPELLAEVLPVIARIAKHDAMTVVDAVPKLATLLQTDRQVEESVVAILLDVAKVHPDSVVPVAPALIECVEEGTDSVKLSALATLGYISKPYPYVAEQTIPEATELLHEENHKLRANAAGLLADLAQEYPGKLRANVPKVIDLLGDADEKVQYNATSILARIANVHPEAVEPATDALIEALEAEMDQTRANACWALGYMNAASAREQIEAVQNHSPNDTVDAAASAALAMFNVTDCPQCGNTCEPHEIEMKVIYPERVQWTCPHCNQTITEPFS